MENYKKLIEEKTKKLKDAAHKIQELKRQLDQLSLEALKLQGAIEQLEELEKNDNPEK